MEKRSLPSIKVRHNITSRSRISRAPKNYVFCDNKENKKSKFVPAHVGCMKKIVQLSKTHDRDVKIEPNNPYEAGHVKLFSSKSEPKELKQEPFIMGDIRTIVDVDPLFFEIIEGRPIRQFIDIKQYIREIRGITTFRTDAAFAKDRILAREDKNANELIEYEQIVKIYENTKSNFVKCIKQSYAHAKTAQIQAEKMAHELADMSDQLEGASFEYVRLRNQLSHMGANFDTLIYFAKTLNSLAPPWWRYKYDNLNNLDNISYIYVEQLTEESKIAKSTSLSTLDGYEITIIKYRGSPHLYLKTPKQLVDMLESFAEQCTNYMKIDAQTSVLRNNLTTARSAIRAQFDLVVTDIEDYLEMYTERIKFYEEREEAYKKAFFKLLMGEFHDLFASYSNTKLYTYIQFANSQIFCNPEDPHDDMMLLMAQLESHYLRITSELDVLDQDIVKKATKISFARDIKGMNDAFKATRVLKEFDILHKTLYTSFEPPRLRTRPEIRGGVLSKKKTKLRETKP